MGKLFDITGSVLGVIGVLACVVALVIRLAGYYTFAGHEPMSLFIVGIGVMVAGCLAKLHART